jgi:predicted DNA-binding transcriptional regulator AlpA
MQDTPPIREAQAARRLGISPDTLARLRKEGLGPPYIRVGKRVIAYDLVDLSAWLNSRRFEPAAGATAVSL